MDQHRLLMADDFVTPGNNPKTFAKTTSYINSENCSPSPKNLRA